MTIAKAYAIMNYLTFREVFMNKGEFIKAIAAKAEITDKDAAKAFEAVTAVITETLKSGDKIQLAGFGTFEIKEKPEREGINPATNEKITIKASKAPSLKFGKAYKDLFN